jgi:flavodoxin
MEQIDGETTSARPLRSLVVVFSYHQMNTEKVARAIAGALGAAVKTPQEIDPEEVPTYDLVGFGSGIYSARNHDSVVDLARRLPRSSGTKAFVFSTFGAPAGLFRGERLREFVRKNHADLRDALESRGYAVMDEFACPGFNTNSFLKVFGGLNRGRPDPDDLGRAEAFARSLAERAGPEPGEARKDVRAASAGAGV